MFVTHTDTLTPLCKIMCKYGSDKGGYAGDFKHNYTQYYHFLFAKKRKQIRNVFEVGIGTTNPLYENNMGNNGKPGASLFGWKEYFPNANIYGADVDKNVLFETDRIKTFFCNQFDSIIIHDMWQNVTLKDIEFDVIIDDGCHNPNANACMFENSIHKLSKKGIYIIEDISDTYLDMWFVKLLEWKDKYPHLAFHIVPIYNIYHYKKFQANNIMVIKYMPTR